MLDYYEDYFLKKITFLFCLLFFYLWTVQSQIKVESTGRVLFGSLPSYAQTHPNDADNVLSMQLFGPNPNQGLYLTYQNTSNSSHTIGFYDVNYGNQFRFNCDVYSSGLFLTSDKRQKESFTENPFDDGERKWWDCVDNHIKYRKATKEKEKKEKLKSSSASSFSVDDLIQSLSSSSSTAVNVPSLFETYQTSRWAGWGPYLSEFPGGIGGNICVPLAMAQIMKYYKFPVQGQGSHNGTDFSRQRYDYDLMPFRLTYCGNGFDNCNDGSFDIIPGVTEANIEAVSRLIWHCAIAVEWTSTGGTNSPSYAINALVNNFNYSTAMTPIAASNSNTFKSHLRNELINKRPILFSFGVPGVMGHSAVIEGVENDNYFHIAMGRGGYEDAYYYLFDLDNDYIHNQIPNCYPIMYLAYIGIEPNCPQSGIVNLSNLVIFSSESESYLSNGDVNVNNFVVKSGGQVTIKAANEVNLGTGFEVELGADVFIAIGTCGPPN